MGVSNATSGRAKTDGAV